MGRWSIIRNWRRQQEAKPVFEKLLGWVLQEQANNLSKGPIGTALFYARNQLPKLSAYLEDSRIEIDNNLIENAIRPRPYSKMSIVPTGRIEELCEIHNLAKPISS